MIGREASRARRRSISHTSCRRFGIGLARLPLDQLVDLLVAIAGVVAVRAARVVLVEHLVGVVDRCLADIDANRIVLADYLWEPVGGLDRFKGAVNVDLLHLVDRDDGRVAVAGGVAGRDGDPEPLVRAVAELFHDRARLGAVLRDVEIVSRQFGKLVDGPAPDAVRRRLHTAADQTLPLDQDIDERFAVEGQRYGAAQFGIVERRLRRVDYQVAGAVVGGDRADRLRNLALYVAQQRHRDTVR